MLYILDIFGTAVFAVTGVLAGGKKRLDLFGCIVLGLVTALGGGTFRDVVLGATPVFWINDAYYILVVVLFSILTFFLAVFLNRISKLILILDAFGLAIFTVIGLQKSLSLGSSYLIAVIMGIATGVLGGICRDMLSGQVPLILRREIYAIASMCGAIAYISVQRVASCQVYAIWVSLFTTFMIRIIALRFNISLPQISKLDSL